MADDRFKVGYPVDFRSGGDTTQQAFGKHIQEIVKIYGDLNALNAESLSSTNNILIYSFYIYYLLK